MLEGPYSSTTGQMSDALRTAGIVPISEPYTALGYAQVGGGGAESIAPTVLSTTGNNAIVDWVVAELRDATTPTVVLATQSALLQRDGDVVGTDGTSPLQFGLGADNYHLALRHRNHLGIMTASAQALSSTATLKDLTNASVGLYGGTSVVKNIGGVRCMFAGDANFSNMVKYAGSSNDRDPILVNIGGSVPTNIRVAQLP